MKRPDLTVEGSFGFGAVIAMFMLLHEVHFIPALLVALLGGAVAGLATALINTKLKVDGIISGLLVTLAMFSVNLLVMGRSNISAPAERFIFVSVRERLIEFGVQRFEALLWSYIIIGALVLILVIAFLHFLYNTKFGLSIRSTGDNERMACSNGINTDSRKIASLVISNAIIGLSGGMVGQMLNGAEVTTGVGTLIIGLAALVIGEVITPKNANILTKMLFIVIGAIVYFSIISLIINFELLDSSWERLLQAGLALVALCIPKVRELLFKKRIEVSK